MARVLYFDCFAGAAGDMVLGALVDLGVPLAELERALGSLGVGHELRVTRVTRAGISANHVQVIDRAQPHGHEHGEQQHHHHEHHEHRHHSDPHEHHDHGHGRSQPAAHHGHRSLDEINRLIGQSALSERGKARAVALFRRIGEAEAAIHGVPVDQIHLHEVGALDSIIDIVGAVHALEWLGVDEVVSSPLNVGAGMVAMAHGTFPVPAPATLRLLAGVPVYSTGVQAELVTPTGALIVSDYAGTYGPLPAMRVDRVGYGAGTRALDPLPNVLRVVLGERIAAGTGDSEAGRVIELACELDDMNPQLYGPLSDRLFQAGALDVFLTPVQMKKGRPGTLVTVLAPPNLREALTAVLFGETTTLGVRWHVAEREVLERRHETVSITGGTVRMKVAGGGLRPEKASPEFDDCVRLAEATGRTVTAVYAEAVRAWALRNRAE